MNPSDCSAETVQNQLNVSKSNPLNNVEEWVRNSDNQMTNLPPDLSRRNSSAGYGSLKMRQGSTDSSYGNISRRKGIQGLNYGRAGDIYSLAMSIRKSRERQNRKSVDHGVSNRASSGMNKYGDMKSEDRISALRAAYAYKGNSFQSDTSSFESGLEHLDELDEENPEDILIGLGFGGPSQGLERIPDRFLKPLMLDGIEIEQFFSTQQEVAQPAETGSFGFREPSGLTSRRSSIASLVLGRFRDSLKEDGRQNVSISETGNTLLPTGSLRPVDHLCVTKEEPLAEEEVHQTVNSSLMSPAGNELAANSRKSSISSRKSSLRRQEHVDLDDLVADELGTDLCGGPTEEDAGHLDELSPVPDAEDGANESLPLHELPFLPTVYVIPPASTSFDVMSDVTVAHEDALTLLVSKTPDEVVDPILSVLQLALEAYRTCLDVSPTKTMMSIGSGVVQSGYDPRDWNHNNLTKEASDLLSIRQDIRNELARTQQLIQGLQQRLTDASRPANPSDDMGAVRNVLKDMTSLLLEQQSLHAKIADVQSAVMSMDEARQPTTAMDSSEENSSLQSSGAGTGSCGSACPSCCSSKASWLRGFERRLTGQVRRVVRREIHKAFSQMRSSNKKCNP